MATWPPGVPFTFQQPGFDLQLGDGAIRTPNDVGPANVRPRFTAIADNLTGVIRMTRAQFVQLRDFHKVTLGLGSDKFDAVDPIEEVSRDFRFLKPPRAVASGPDWVDAYVALEMLP